MDTTPWVESLGFAWNVLSDASVQKPIEASSHWVRCSEKHKYQQMNKDFFTAQNEKKKKIILSLSSNHQ